MSNYRYDYEYLIHLVRCALTDKKPDEKPDNISFENVFELGKVHEVANIAYLAVEALDVKPDEKLLNDWKIFYYFSVERDSRQRLEYKEIIDLLHSNGIRTLEAQGTITKTLYPSPELRMMSDIDFIVDFENIGRVCELMSKVGYDTNFVQDGELDTHHAQKQSEVEFHTEFFTEYMYNREERFFKAINSPFEHAEKSDRDELGFVLDDTYFYLYSVLHIIKHFETAGCGIRRLLDLYYLKNAYEGKVDEKLINRVIDENDFRDSFDTLFAIEGVWFEDGESERDLSEAIADIVNSGNHGSAEIHLRNNLQKDREEGIRFPKLKAIINFVFPSKKYICVTYPECEERGYSYARCWFYRLCGTLKRFDFSSARRHIKFILKSK